MWVCQEPDYFATLRLAFVLTVVAFTSLRPTKPNHTYTHVLRGWQRENIDSRHFLRQCACAYHKLSKKAQATRGRVRFFLSLSLMNDGVWQILLRSGFIASSIACQEFI